MKIELHCHTTYSDGRLTPEELYHLAVKEGLSYMALTDHDSVKGHFEISTLMDRSDIRFIPGIELTTSRNGESIHILGYWNNEGYKNQGLLSKLDELHHARDERIIKFIQNLEHYFDMDIDYDKLRETNQGVLTRANLAHAVHEKVPQLTYNEAFMKYLDKDSPAYIPNVKLTVEEGIALLKKNGAIVVLAHPVIYRKNTLEELLLHEFDGVECYYYLNDEEMTGKSLDIARRNNLLITAGSDFHGIQGDIKHGYLGSMHYDPADLKPFLDLF
ncbi:PHP domain-containing protein [Proteiniclasticum sp.]|uniref:PHP domain-containing protein n=1 Tax=Proteiniclasticum sp. TaxID=2053595 RepID=UPI0028A003E2|nr:PHP domain-containing protein [Proteiniclasticum sp.]